MGRDREIAIRERRDSTATGIANELGARGRNDGGGTFVGTVPAGG